MRLVFLVLSFLILLMSALSAHEKKMQSVVKDRIKASMFGMYAADATAMPVHWMYDLRQLKNDYGTIKHYVKPKDKFRGSIMNLSNTGGGGRGSDKGNIVGDVILHGKKKYWQRGGNNHYHLGLSAGENTLEAQLARLLTRTLAADLTEKKTQQSNFLDSFRSKYVDFMTTPGNHRDTYASTCHRMFFANWADGVAPEKCPDNDGHNVDSIDLLTLTVPVILRYADASAEVRNKKVLDTIAVTRKTSRSMDRFAKAYATMLSNVVKGASLRDEAEAAYKSLGGRYTMKEAVASSYGDPMTACYMNSSFPALLHFAYKYADSPEEAILANANAGGENVARGSLLGALMGAAHGLKAFPAWSHKLHEYDSIMGEIDAFASALPEPSSPSVMSKY